MSYQNILVPVDGSDISFSALKHAASIAKALGSKVTAISVVADDPFAAADFYYSPDMLKEYIKEAVKSAEEALEKAKKIAEEAGVQIETQVVRNAVSAETVTQTADSLKTDLIVMGSHGRKGFQKFFLGSFAQDILGQTQIPVLIVKQ
ncbi:universal stress protein [Acinetobacter sp. WCHAc060033]|uniref:universal stress protein n=1 Tax=Acinetobacter sp. WCHAc060033 TaxID=2518624 RepID=UPI0010231994|nr:universal stress protein [Acinetobacter sp. WCHAc060033]RZG81035.1 universal stress protein [Acinetobacter sp. WCHAc060033]